MGRNRQRVCLLFIFVGAVTGMLRAEAPGIVHESRFYFSPRGGCPEALIALIGKATRTLDMATYALSDDDVAKALAVAAGRGVAIRIAGNKGANCPTEKVEVVLKAAGLQVEKKKTPGLLHDKYVIVDGEYVLTGSYNFTVNANTDNRENLAVMHGAEVAKLFQADFEKIWLLPPYVPPSPRPDPFLRRMKRETRRWVAKGIITPEQARKIVGEYE